MFFAGDGACAFVMSGADGNDAGGVIDSFMQLKPGHMSANFGFSGYRHLWFDGEEKSHLHAQVYSENIIAEGFPAIEQPIDARVAKRPNLLNEID
jgi:hypothetical protein